MAAGRFVVPPYFPARDRDDALLAGAKLYVYENLTTALDTVYSDEAMTTPIANPVIANASGQFPEIWAEAGTEADPQFYSVSVTTATGAAPGNVFTFDNYRPSVDFDTAAVALSEAAAASSIASAAAAAIAAGVAQDALDEIVALAALYPDTILGFLNKLNLNGSNVAGNAATLRANIGAVGSAALAAGTGGTLVGVQPASVARTLNARLSDEISLWDINGIYQNMAAIKAGSYNVSLTAAINTALQNYTRVIVRKGIYPISAPILFALQEQQLEFEDGAWFLAMSSGTNGIACPHGLNGVQLINPGLIGVATTQAVGNHTAILWNSNAGGTAPFGSATTDDMGGLVDNGRFKGSNPGVNGWNTFIHSNMAGGFVARNCVGKGLYGTSTDYGYGHNFSGNNVRSQDNEFDAVISGQGRHAVYMGDQVAGSMVTGVTARNFRKSAIAANTGTTGANRNLLISNVILRDVCLDADASATNAAIEINYQSPATAGGSGLNISNVQVDGVGALGVFIRGYTQAQISNVQVSDWGKNAGGSYSALKLMNCDDAQISNFTSYSSAANNGGNTIQHVLIQESRRVQIRGGKVVNTGSGAQGSGVALNATGIGTPDAIIDRVPAVQGTGSWSLNKYVNPTQNGSIVVYPKAGAHVVDTQTGVDITLDASDGQSSFVMASGATSVLQILPAGVGQVVTLRMTGATQIKQSNIYSPSVFNADANDTCTLICGTAAGASSLWYEVARSVN